MRIAPSSVAPVWQVEEKLECRLGQIPHLLVCVRLCQGCNSPINSTFFLNIRKSVELSHALDQPLRSSEGLLVSRWPAPRAHTVLPRDLGRGSRDWRVLRCGRRACVDEYGSTKLGLSDRSIRFACKVVQRDRDALLLAGSLVAKRQQPDAEVRKR